MWLLGLTSCPLLGFCAPRLRSLLAPGVPGFLQEARWGALPASHHAHCAAVP